jgi:hypothetical protein
LSRKVLFSAVKNEGPVLLEWVAYHRLIGFDAIYIASNDCTDGTDTLLDALEAEGVITKHLPHKPDPRFGPQKSAIFALNKDELLQDDDWLLFLDADEYLNIHLGRGMVDDLIAKIGSHKGMVIPWRLFGDGGTTGIIQRHVDDTFRMAQAQPTGKSSHVKTIFRYQTGKIGFAYGNMHRPRIEEPGFVALNDFLLAGDVSWDTNRRINAEWMAGSKGGMTAYISPEEFSTEFAQINHYSVRNRDMFNLKKKRGRGFFRKKAAKAAPRVRHNDKFYREHNCNDVEDSSILRHKDALDTLIDRYLKIPAISSFHADVVALTERELTLIKNEAALGAGLSSPSKVTLKTKADEVFLPKITLPEPEAACLTEHYQDAQTILEYGSGGSTVFAANLPHNPKLFSIETDKQWSAKLDFSIKSTYPNSNIHMRYVNIGHTKAWGRPQSHDSYFKYPNYAFGIYDDPTFDEPDLILIDGRFRQACFYAALFKMTKPVTLLWDDYTNRPKYHGVERYFKPVEKIGRMARFEVSPMSFPTEDIMLVIKGIMDVE